MLLPLVIRMMMISAPFVLGISFENLARVQTLIRDRMTVLQLLTLAQSGKDSDRIKILNHAISLTVHLKPEEGNRLLPWIRPLLRDRNESIRSLSARLIENCHIAEIEDDLRAGLRDPSELVRKAFILTVTSFHEEAIGVLPDLLRNLESEATRDDAIEAICGIGPKVIPTLRESWSKKSNPLSIRTASLEIFHQLVIFNPREVDPELLSLWELTNDVQLGGYALFVIGAVPERLPNRTQHQFERIAIDFNHPLGVRLVAADRLAHWSPSHPCIRECYLSGLKSRIVSDRRLALNLLAGSSQSISLVNDLSRLIDDPDPECQKRTLDILRDLGSDAKSALPKLEQANGNRDHPHPHLLQSTIQSIKSR